MNPDEKTIIVMNHRTRLDWNYVWIALYHATQDPSSELCTCKQPVQETSDSSSVLDVGGKSKIKFVLKDEIKNIPGMGKFVLHNYVILLYFVSTLLCVMSIMLSLINFCCYQKTDCYFKL